ncbi:carbohydrate ABC transporter substrate-binding protein [Dehalobacter sp. DCM]|uniref:carbohydrate ABC transporter substrate-binding protein n=1 Tax=Dehalobacter sp. DCM TaxID=2907827 RepID=UPI00308206EB|nr:carbohydrate ABC transporter substrate-binding protein [Dehalobacter sp. DCM]
MKTQYRKKINVCLLCIVLAVTVLTGCSGGPSPGEPGGDAPVTVTVWYSLQGQQEQALLKQFARINNEFPEVRVKSEKFSESGFVQRVYNYQAGGEGPEIIIARRQILFSIYEKGMISPVLADTESLYPSAKAVFIFNKQAFAASWLTDVPLLYYRTDRIKTAPASITDIIEKKGIIAASTASLDLLSPWWIAEGGMLSANGVPALDSAANLTFFNKINGLKKEGRLVVDNTAWDKFKEGEIPYLLALGSDMEKISALSKNTDCIALYTLLGDKGQPLLSNTIGIANSLIKTVPEMESAIRLVEEELITSTSEQEAFSAVAGLPAASDYYTAAAQPSRFQAEVGVSLQNAFYLEGSRYDWKYYQLLADAWTNINSGANTANELRRVQEAAVKVNDQIQK